MSGILLVAACLAGFVAFLFLIFWAIEFSDWQRNIRREREDFRRWQGARMQKLTKNKP